jgi:hypothetical protein
MTGVVIANGIAALTPSLAFANMLLPLYVVTALYFGGFLIIYDQIPTGWQWYSHTVFLRYGWTALMTNQFDNHLFTTRESSSSSSSSSSGGSSLDDDGTSSLFRGEHNILKFYNINNEDKWINFSVLCMICFIISVLGFLAVKYVDYSKR